MEALHIEPLEPGGSPGTAWDEYVARSPHATMFHQRAWMRALEKSFPYRSYSCVAKAGGQVRGVLPLYHVRLLPFGSSLVSLPWAVYGGACADTEAVRGALYSHAQSAAKNLRVRYMELRHQIAYGDWPVKDLYVTFRKEIFADPEKNLAAIPRKQRRMAKQGDKHDLTMEVGGESLLKGFYAVYSHSVRNLGTPVFPFSWFANLLREFGDSCRILGVFKERSLVAAVMTFFFRDEIYPYYGGALRSAFQYAANDFMYWKLMCYGGELGYRVFDFGRSKQGTGAFDFKRHWGFEPTPLPYQYCLVEQRTIPDLSPKNPKLSLPIRIWKTLPLPVTQWLGPKVIQFFP